jgi:hypothetical protein
MADDILAQIRSLEAEVGQAAETVRLPGQSDDRLTEALVDAIIELVTEGGLTVGDLDSTEFVAEVAEVIFEAFADWNGETRQSMLAAVQDSVQLVEKFYNERGLDTTGLRAAAQRSQLAQTITQSLDAGLNQIQEQLRVSTVDAMRDQILSGRIDRVALADQIEKDAKTGAGYARIQAHAAVGGFNQAYREEVARRAGLTHYHYFGPVQNNTRPFCRIHVGYVFPRNRIEQMINGMLEPVLTFKGGYNCRHAWLPVDLDWDPALAAKLVDEEPTDVATQINGKGIITVIAPAGRIDRLKSQIPLQPKGYLRFYDAESSESGYVAVHESWHVARLGNRAGSKKRKQFDDQLNDALRRAEAGEQVQLRAKGVVRTDGYAPAGTPIANALHFTFQGDTRDAADRAVDLIGSLHGDGVLPRISVSPETRSDAAGSYDWSKKSMKVSGLLTESTMIHETAHMLDHLAIKSGHTYASEESTGVFQDWFRAVSSSDAYKNLISARNDPGRPLPLNNIDYFLSRRELWARTYEQYVAVKTGDRIVRDQMDDYARMYKGFPYWSEQDFKPIEAAIDNLFTSLQWTTKQ